MRELAWTGLSVLLGLGWFVLATWAVAGPGFGVALLAPLAFLGLAFVVVWVRGRRYRRKLLDQEFRE